MINEKHLMMEYSDLNEPSLQIAEKTDEHGVMRYRYTYYFSEEQGERVRHGLFTAYHANGNMASEGLYEHGLEQGLWRDFHENGKLAAQGYYVDGKQNDGWVFWHEDGSLNTAMI